MNKSVLLVLIGICSLTLNAQDTKPEAGDVDINDKKKETVFYDNYEEYQERKNKHWQGLDIGINGFLYEDGSDNPPPGYEYLRLDYSRSFYFGVNLFEVGYPINGELIKMVTGLGFDFNNFQLVGSNYLGSRNDSLVGVPDSSYGFYNSNMKNGHVTVPLLLAFNTSPKNSSSFHIAIGAVFSYRLSGKQKIKYYSGEVKNEHLRYGRMHQNPWRINATLRLGYANFHVFGNYNLLDYWESGHAPKTSLWTVGIKVIPW